MPLGNKVRKQPLTPDNLAHLEEIIKPIKNGPEHLGLLLLIADMFDAIARGENWYMVIGSTKMNDAFSITLKNDDDAEYAFGTSLADISLKAYSLL